MGSPEGIKETEKQASGRRITHGDLTIHYILTMPGEMPVDAVKAKLEQIRQRCLDLPVEKVDAALQDFKGKECSHEHVESLREIKAPADKSLV